MSSTSKSPVGPVGGFTEKAVSTKNAVAVGQACIQAMAVSANVLGHKEVQAAAASTAPPPTSTPQQPLTTSAAGLSMPSLDEITEMGSSLRVSPICSEISTSPLSLSDDGKLIMDVLMEERFEDEGEAWKKTRAKPAVYWNDKPTMDQLQSVSVAYIILFHVATGNEITVMRSGDGGQPKSDEGRMWLKKCHYISNIVEISFLNLSSSSYNAENL